ncbi:MAG: cephalosporin hydroxylase family protein [Candidatus Calescibacterium sp.]|nr:cephalosporin hydroxylase family protein [Candidatus Calescibacterium sp.]MDW8086707.1 CmcI family methyltransferase [Candidatus Calescibacterium sp.]
MKVRKFMEEMLSNPLYEILPIIQDRITKRNTWFGVKTQKHPYDFWIYQEILWCLRPDYVIEIGNYMGGSTLALAHICDLLGKGKIIGIDINQKNIPSQVREHPRITLMEGDACDLFEKVKNIVGDSFCIVIEDSSHTYDNTLKILRLYSQIVKPGGYIIIEDSICWHGLSLGPFPGPYEAIEVFLQENKDFEIDRDLEFPITWNPKGYLLRIR